MAGSTAAGEGMLFACTHCHKRVIFEELSANQQLCKDCRKKYPLVTCTYCRLDFHPVRNSQNRDSRPACDHCAKDFKQYGTPSFCAVCNLQSAFNSRKCTRCAHSEKKYGSPVSCEQCKMVCAFNKPDDVKRKVGGQTLCLLCTINFKKAQFKRKQHEKNRETPKPSSTAATKKNTSASSTTGNRSLKHRDRHRADDESSVSKRAKLDLPPPPPSSDASSSPQFLSTLTRDSQPIDLISSNHLMETDRLYSEIASLKKQVAQKEQSLLEKDKQICQLKAETMEKEKDFRIKFQSHLRSHSDTVESLQAEIRTLRKQLSQQSSHKSGSSLFSKGTGGGSAAKSGSSSAHASLAAALTSGVTSSSS